MPAPNWSPFRLASGLFWTGRFLTTAESPGAKSPEQPKRHSSRCFRLRSSNIALQLNMSRRTIEFQTIRSEGGLLPPDLLRRIVDPASKVGGVEPTDYG